MPSADEARRIRVYGGFCGSLDLAESANRHLINRMIQAMEPIVGEERVTEDEE